MTPNDDLGRLCPVCRTWNPQRPWSTPTPLGTTLYRPVGTTDDHHVDVPDLRAREPAPSTNLPRGRMPAAAIARARNGSIAANVQWAPTSGGAERTEHARHGSPVSHECRRRKITDEGRVREKDRPKAAESAEDLRPLQGAPSPPWSPSSRPSKPLLTTRPSTSATVPRSVVRCSSLPASGASRTSRRRKTPDRGGPRLLRSAPVRSARGGREVCTTVVEDRPPIPALCHKTQKIRRTLAESAAPVAKRHLRC